MAGVPSNRGRFAPIATSAVSAPMTGRRELCSGHATSFGRRAENDSDEWRHAAIGWG